MHVFEEEQVTIMSMLALVSLVLMSLVGFHSEVVATHTVDMNGDDCAATAACINSAAVNETAVALQKNYVEGVQVIKPLHILTNAEAVAYLEPAGRIAAKSGWT